jgi:threonine dehydrogenase-like Zn-dependent dehydrogenase
MVRAAVMPAPFAPVEVRTYPDPVLAEGEVLLETLCSEVCGTDVHLHRGRLEGVPYPLIPGHVSVGRVLEVRGPVHDTEGRPVRPGQVTTFLDVHETCGHCWYCLVAREATKCPSRKVYGITYGAQDGLLGGWSERIVLKAGVKIIPLPEGMEAVDYMGGGCGLSTGFHAVERAAVRLGDTVVVQGAGHVGLAAAVFARLSGAGQVIVIGAPRDRLEMALRFEADLALDVTALTPVDRLETVREHTDGRGADVVIEATGNPLAVPEGMELARDGGTYVIAGQYTDEGDVLLNPHRHINRKHLTVKGCWGTAFTHLWRAIRETARYTDRFPWRDFVSHTFPLEGANEALEAVAGLKARKALIVPGDWQPEGGRVLMA